SSKNIAAQATSAIGSRKVGGKVRGTIGQQILDCVVVPFSQGDVGRVEIVIDAVEEKAKLQRVAAANPIEVVRRLVGGEVEIVRAGGAEASCRAQVAGGKNSHWEAWYEPKLCIRIQPRDCRTLLRIRCKRAAHSDAP